MAKKYKVFNYDSRNTGFYCMQDINLKQARELAIRLSRKAKYPKARVEEEGAHYFEEYENGEKTSWTLSSKDKDRISSIQNSQNEFRKEFLN